MRSFRTACKHIRLLCVILPAFFHQAAKAQDRCGVTDPAPEQFEYWLSQKIADFKKNERASDRQPPVYEIPVVVHIIEPANGSSLNITDARVIRQIEILNEDFRRTNEDASNTPAVFLPVAADSEIQFVLAKQDPAGNPTNGIVRVRGTRDQYSSLAHEQLIRSESYWPPEHYLNIHVLDLFFLLGWASFPVTDLEGINNGPSDLIWDGILIDYEYFGDNPSAPDFPSFGRTGTHEIGHYLGLRHIWGDGPCSIDDFVDDTPLADDDNGGLSSPCTFPSNDSNVCTTQAEMFQNYMDYTDDGCMNLFTLGQKTRMRTVLENSPRRQSLLTSPGLSDPLKVANDLAITSIVSPEHAECDNLVTPSVQITNYGSNAVSSFEITLSVNSAVVQTINQSSTLNLNESEIVTFNAINIPTAPELIEFSITEVNTVSDGNTQNNSRQITLTQVSSVSLPFTADFETGSNLNGEIGATRPWEIAVVPKESPTNNALQFKGYQNTTIGSEHTILKTPVFDLRGINSAELKFIYAYAYQTDAFRDGLTVKISTDCGATFSNEFLFDSYGPDLATAGQTSSSFTPQDMTDWKDTTINITKFVNTDGVQFAFTGHNGGNNNIYIDDILVRQTTINATDASIAEIDVPLLTCRESTSADFFVRNVGYQEITQLTYQYTSEGNMMMETLSDISLLSGEFQRINLNLPLSVGANDIDFSVTSVNGISDEDVTNNSVQLSVDRSSSEDTYPLLVDFETSNLWETVTSGSTQLWQKTSAGTNGVLMAGGFLETQTGTNSWFISPALNVGSLDSAGLSFRASYASRTGFEDRLRVLMSIDCGETYTFELLNADSDSLAVTQSPGPWIPFAESDWKEFKLDLRSSIPWKDEIRIAFVFTNGNGNNLYIDDINIGLKPDIQDSGGFIVFPNPAQSKFNIAFSLPEREDVQVQIMDVSGKVIFTRAYKNVLDQVFDFDTISQDGFYFVKITGKSINKTERLYIRR